jgi:staphylococcal nuclease domain-containing protein 1
MDPARLPEGSILAEAQKQAKEARLKIWEKWTPEQEALENGGEADATAELGIAGAPSASQEVLEVVVTEVVSCNEFFLQRVDEPRLAWISEQLRAVALSDGPVIPVS